MKMTYSEAVDYIINVPRFNKYIDQKHKANVTLTALMDRLDNPHLRVKAIHVAGTNGKGSTVQLIKNILVESGYKVGCFVSPHLIKINERISVWSSLDSALEDTYISDEDFLEAFMTVERAYNHIKEQGLPSLTFFEYVFAIATVYFADKNLDYCIYETGLGGRLDATNILIPEISVITSIGLDHMKLLGDTIEQIAGEKAGIIKPGVAVVYNTGDEVADKVISQQAMKLNSSEYNVAKAQYIINDFTPYTIDFSCSNSYYIYQHINISSLGVYQVSNALTAIEACNNLPGVSVPISEDVIRSACGKFFWQGRMERLDDNLILDGAHNLDAIIPFTKSVKALCRDTGVNILFAVADDKNYEDMIKYLCENLKLNNVYVTSIISDRKVLSEEVAEIFSKYMNFELCKPQSAHIFFDNDLKKAFTIAYNRAREAGEILFCVGSLYLIGSIKELYMEELKDD
ncbi:MAG: bifunctional folylpolyglutamate synthase/dihydrofolate synthase [Lachnospiraceae bacterium]|nr:bifunctional folylpolyglutamate synthase/dihydrofolate synthase [Lachnospiraceae bacterium]